MLMGDFDFLRNYILEVIKMFKGKLRSLLLVFIMVFAVSSVLFTFDEDSEVSIGVKRNLAVHGCILSLVLHDGSTQKIRLKEKDVVQSGQRFSIAVNSSSGGYIYVLSIDADNILYAMYPNEDMPRRRFSPGSGLMLPISKGEQTALFEFDENTGKETYYVFVSKDPMDNLEKLIKSIPEDGLDLAENKQTMKKILKYYRRGSKRYIKGNKRSERKGNVAKKKYYKGDDVNTWKVYYKKYYAKKYVFDHQ